MESNREINDIFKYLQNNNILPTEYSLENFKNDCNYMNWEKKADKDMACKIALKTILNIIEKTIEKPSDSPRIEIGGNYNYLFCVPPKVLDSLGKKVQLKFSSGLTYDFQKISNTKPYKRKYEILSKYTDIENLNLNANFFTYKNDIYTEESLKQGFEIFSLENGEKRKVENFSFTIDKLNNLEIENFKKIIEQLKLNIEPKNLTLNMDLIIENFDDEKYSEEKIIKILDDIINFLKEKGLKAKITLSRDIYMKIRDKLKENYTYIEDEKEKNNWRDCDLPLCKIDIENKKITNSDAKILQKIAKNYLSRYNILYQYEEFKDRIKKLFDIKDGNNIPIVNINNIMFGDSKEYLENKESLNFLLSQGFFYKKEESSDPKIDEFKCEDIIENVFINNSTLKEIFKNLFEKKSTDSEYKDNEGFSRLKAQLYSEVYKTIKKENEHKINSKDYYEYIAAVQNMILKENCKSYDKIYENSFLREYFTKQN